MPKQVFAKLIGGFDRLAAAGFKTAPEWEAVHEICQNHEGQPIFDWGHALCHRVEGDDWNASYWYRRAGKAVGAGTMADEWAAMRNAISGKV